MQGQPYHMICFRSIASSVIGACIMRASLAFVRRFVRGTSTTEAPSKATAERQLPMLVQRLWRLAPWQVGLAGAGMVFAGVTAVSTFSDRVPAYVVYVKSTGIGEGEFETTSTPSDPKAEVKLCNNGGGPTRISAIEIRANGKKVKTLREAIGPSTEFVMSTESEPFLQGGFDVRPRHEERVQDGYRRAAPSGRRENHGLGKRSPAGPEGQPGRGYHLVPVPVRAVLWIRRAADAWHEDVEALVLALCQLGACPECPRSRSAARIKRSCGA